MLPLLPEPATAATTELPLTPWLLLLPLPLQWYKFAHAQYQRPPPTGSTGRPSEVVVEHVVWYLVGAHEACVSNSAGRGPRTAHA